MGWNFSRTRHNYHYLVSYVYVSSFFSLWINSSWLDFLIICQFSGAICLIIFCILSLSITRTIKSSIYVLKSFWLWTCKKTYRWTADKDVNTKAILALMITTWSEVKISPEKNSGLCGIWTHDLCDTGEVLCQSS